MAVRSRTRSDERRRLTQRAVDSEFAAITKDISNSDDRDYVMATAGASRRQSVEPWKWFDSIGEVRYAIDRTARIAGYATFFARRMQANGKYKVCVPGAQKATSWDQKAARIIEEIYSPYGGTRHLVERYYALRKITGDMHLIAVSDEQGQDGYCFISCDEMDDTTPKEGGIIWKQSSIKGSADATVLTRKVLAKDYIGRVYAPSKRFIADATSPLSAMSTECEVLWNLTEAMKGRIKSRFALAGILGLPQEIQGVRRNQNGKMVPIEDLATYLIKAMTANIQGIDTAEAVVPIILTGPGEKLAQITKIDWDRVIDKTDLVLRAELINRILFGLDSNQDAVKGTSEQSHWGSWNANDDERRVAVEPDLDDLDFALTRMILHRRLKEEGCPADQILTYSVGHDMSKALVKTNAAEDVRQAADRGVANRDALALSAGLREEHILDPNSAEYVRWIGVKLQDRKLAAYGTPVFDLIPWEDSGSKTGPAPDSPGEEPSAGPGVGDPGSPNPSDRDTDTPRTERPA